MNYKEWSDEYFESAENFARLIKKLTNTRKTACISEKKDIDTKISQYRQCRYECLDIARILYNRHLGIA